MIDPDDVIFDDPVFVMSLLIHSLPEQYLKDAALEHRLGGPTGALLSVGKSQYRVTIEKV